MDGVSEFSVRKLAQRRYLSLLMCFLIELTAGTLYAFSVHGPTIKEKIGITQTQINMIGSFGYAGQSCGFLMGLLYQKAGLRITLATGSILGGLGYILSYVCISSGLSSTPKLALLSFLFLLIGQGGFASGIVCLGTNFKNFPPRHNGKISGLMLSAYGLGSLFFAIIWQEFFAHNDNVNGFLIAGGVIVSLVPLLGVLVVREESQQSSSEDQESKRLIFNDSKDPDPDHQRDRTLIEALKTADYWLFILGIGIAGGCGSMVINSVGSIRLTFGGSVTNSKQSDLVIVLAICNSLGRLFWGWISDHFDRKISRTFWLFVNSTILLSTYLIFCIGPSGPMTFFLAAATGFSYGGYFGISPGVLSSFFGTKYFGTIWGVSVCAPASGSFLMSYISGTVYDYYGNTNPNGDEECYGADCYRITFFVSFLLNVVGAGSALVLFIRRSNQSRRAL